LDKTTRCLIASILISENYLKMKKIFWFQGFLFLFASMQCLLSQDSSPTPTAIIRAVFWDRFTNRDLFFAPWGNLEDTNSTILNSRVGFSSPSRSIAYYGQSPFRFFTRKVTQSPVDVNSTKQEFSKVVEFPFSPKQGVIQKFLLILLKQPQSQEFKIYPLPISQGDLPFGSFVCYSQVRETLYMGYGNQKNVLNPGKSAKFSYLDTDDEEKLKLRVFKRKNSKYEAVLIDKIQLNRESRMVAFLSSSRNRIRIKKYNFSREPLEKSLGYMTSALTQNPEKPEMNANQESDNLAPN
jgi:hypothetical protein